MNEKNKLVKLSRFVLFQTMIIGVLFSADQIFGFFEQNFFNTYIAHVLLLPEIYVSIMVSLSAVMGLVFNLVWGIVGDNTRSRYGRRRPYLLIGGVVAGIAAVFYAMSPNYIWAVFLDVVIIGIFSNAFYSADRAIIPDTIDKEYRGRSNGIITAFGNIGVLVAVALFLVVDFLFTVPAPSGEGNILTQEGHLFAISIGGGLLIICSILGFALLKEKPVSELPPKKGFMVELKEIMSIKELKKQTEFFKITLAYTIFQIGIGMITPFLFIYLFSLGLSTLELLIGILIGFPILMITAIFLGRLSDKYGRKKYVPLAILITSLGTSLASFAKTDTGVNLILFYISIPFVLIGLLGLAAPLNAWSQDLLPENKRGKFFGILNIVFTIPQIVGAFLSGIVAMYFGLQWIFLCAIAFFIVSILFFRGVKETYKIEKR